MNATNKYQILEPLSSMVSLALLNFRHKPKISIRNFGIDMDVSGDSYIPRKFKRFICRDSKEDIIILNNMILNYIDWFIIDNYNDRFDIYKNIAICAVSGMRKLQNTYKTGNVIMALQYYIILIMKSISDMEEKRSSSKEKTKTKSTLIKNSLAQHPPKKPDNIDDIVFSLDEDCINDDSQSDDSTCDDSLLGKPKPKPEPIPIPTVAIAIKSHSPVLELDYEENHNLEDYDTVNGDIGNRDDSSFIRGNSITNRENLELWAVPMKKGQSIVDSEKIKKMWKDTDVDDLYGMLSDCFDTTNENHFKPKFDPFVEAKITALMEVLKHKDSVFNKIIKNSYGGN